MIDQIIQFTLAAGSIVIAGIFLVHSSDAIAELTGIGRVLVGSIFLAGATSLPELFVDLGAINRNLPDIAVGDLMGSSLFNLLILAFADLIHKDRGRIFSKTSAAHALSSAMSINVTALVGIAILLAPQTREISFGGLGVGTFAIAVTYILGIRLIFRSQNISLNRGIENTVKEKKKLIRAAAIYLSSALVIMIAAPYLAEAAGEIAEITGLGNTFIGTTLVALCTSLPELVSTITAVRAGAYDLAIGNIFGSNSFNMILLVPLDFAYPGPLLASVSPAHILTCLGTIFATSVAVMGQLYGVEKRKGFFEPDAFAIISIILGSLWILYRISV